MKFGDYNRCFGCGNAWDDLEPGITDEEARMCLREAIETVAGELDDDFDPDITVEEARMRLAAIVQAIADELDDDDDDLAAASLSHPAARSRVVAPEQCP